MAAEISPPVSLISVPVAEAVPPKPAMPIAAFLRPVLVAPPFGETVVPLASSVPRLVIVQFPPAEP